MNAKFAVEVCVAFPLWQRIGGGLIIEKANCIESGLNDNSFNHNIRCFIVNYVGARDPGCNRAGSHRDLVACAEIDA